MTRQSFVGLFALLVAPLAVSAGCSLITDVDHLRNGARDGGTDGESDVGTTDVAFDSTPSDAAVVGRLFVASGTIHDSTHPNDLIAADVHDDGTTGPWAPAEKTPPTDCLACAVTRSGPYVYIVGPNEVDEIAKTVRFATITGTGLSDWALGAPLPSARAKLAVVATDKFLYAIGGQDTAVLSDVLVSPISATDGSNGAWTPTTSLPAPRYAHVAALSHDHIWVIGGTNAEGGAVTGDYFEATVQSDGTISAWKTLTGFPAPPFAGQAVVASDHLYVIGGYDVRVVTYSAIDATTGELGAWISGEALGSPHAHFGAVSTGGFLFALAGFDDASALTSTVEVSQLSATGAPGPWHALAPLPDVRTFHVAFAAP